MGKEKPKIIEMKQSIFIFSILLCCFWSYSQSLSIDSFDQISNCRKNAANKIVDNYARQISDYHDIIDIDVIDYLIKGYSNRYLFSIQWVAKHNGEMKVFWVSGVLSMKEDCCDAKFLLKEYSSTINPAYIDESLNCTDQFIQRSLGSGKPFRRKSKKN